MSDRNNTYQELLSFISEARKFMKSIQAPEWVGSAELTDEEHLSELTEQFKISRNLHGLPAKTAMHSVRGQHNGFVYAYTGNTPQAAQRARFLTGLLTALPRLLEGMEAFMVREVFAEARVKELLEHNNAQLMENRAQRQEIRQLKAQVDLLLKSIPVEPDTLDLTANPEAS
ncbi:hypothetical protein [Bradyrhizobium phage BDU-MI-1]|nr:hypothetical protein [Bradyrhizobium phage BDU-MI-1]